MCPEQVGKAPPPPQELHTGSRDGDGAVGLAAEDRGEVRRYVKEKAEDEAVLRPEQEEGEHLPQDQVSGVGVYVRNPTRPLFESPRARDSRKEARAQEGSYSNLATYDNGHVGDEKWGPRLGLLRAFSLVLLTSRLCKAVQHTGSRILPVRH